MGKALIVACAILLSLLCVFVSDIIYTANQLSLENQTLAKLKAISEDSGNHSFEAGLQVQQEESLINDNVWLLADFFCLAIIDVGICVWLFKKQRPFKRAAVAKVL
jgi:hypothetical protein